MPLKFALWLFAATSPSTSTFAGPWVNSSQLASSKVCFHIPANGHGESVSPCNGFGLYPSSSPSSSPLNLPGGSRRKVVSQKQRNLSCVFPPVHMNNVKPHSRRSSIPFNSNPISELVAATSTASEVSTSAALKSAWLSSRANNSPAPPSHTHRPTSSFKPASPPATHSQSPSAAQAWPSSALSSPGSYSPTLDAAPFILPVSYSLPAPCSSWASAPPSRTPIAPCGPRSPWSWSGSSSTP